MKRVMMTGAAMAALMIAGLGTASEAAAQTAHHKAKPKTAAERANDEMSALAGLSDGSGGPTNCYDPVHTSARQQAVLQRLGGSPCARSATPPKNATPRAAPHTAVSARTATVMPAPPALTRDWIVGKWVVPSSGCGGEADLTLKADGTYLTSFEIGTWRLTGDTITLTALQQYETGQPTRAIPRPKPIPFAVRVTEFDRMNLTRTGNPPQALMRCGWH